MLIVIDRNGPLTTEANPLTTGHGGEPKSHKLIPPLLPYTTYGRIGQPLPQIIFPLSADHCLITLVQYNVIRAMLFNMGILSILDCLPLECSLAFGISFLGTTTAPETIPPDLQPTPL